MRAAVVVEDDLSVEVFEAWHIGPAPAAQSYLQADRLLEVARKYGLGNLASSANWASSRTQRGTPQVSSRKRRSMSPTVSCSISMTEIGMEDIVPISDFVRNASEHAARIRETNRAEILTQHGRPSLAVLPAEEYERLMASKDYLESVEAIRVGLQAAEDGQVRAAEEVIADWETL